MKGNRTADPTEPPNQPRTPPSGRYLINFWWGGVLCCSQINLNQTKLNLTQSALQPGCVLFVRKNVVIQIVINEGGIENNVAGPQSLSWPSSFPWRPRWGLVPCPCQHLRLHPPSQRQLPKGDHKSIFHNQILKQSRGPGRIPLLRLRRQEKERHPQPSSDALHPLTVPFRKHAGPPGITGQTFSPKYFGPIISFNEAPNSFFKKKNQKLHSV